MKLCAGCKNTYPDDYQVCPRDQTTLTLMGPDIYPGTILRGKYEVLSELGAGGMATVYKVRHKAFHELAAVKVVHTRYMDDADFIKRFRNEAVVARQLKHPHAVRIDDFDYTDDGRPFIVMEFVDGRSLHELRKSSPGPWPVERCLNITSQAAEALGAAHGLGIVHRDIKPANILLLRGDAGQPLVKVLDFGIAKVAGDAFAGMTAIQTHQSLVIGTPEYMSPEQASGGLETAINGRSDLYSLGLVLYEMLTGAHPFQADTPIGMMMHQVNTQPAPPELAGRSIPPAISAVVLKCLQKDPLRRFQSAAEMLSALADPEGWYASTLQSRLPAYRTAPPQIPAVQPPLVGVAAGLPGLAHTPAPAPAERQSSTSRRPVLVAALIVLGVLICAVVLYGTLNSRPGVKVATPATAPITQESSPAQTSPAASERKDKVAKLIANGNRSLASEDYDIAAEFFEEGLGLDPGSVEAANGLQKARAGQAGLATQKK